MSELVMYASAEAKTIERQLDLLSPRLAQILGRQMDPARLVRTIMISLDRTPKLLRCDRQTIFNAALSAACLGLEVDGVTGQAFLLPFKDRAQLVTGYKGYNTLAARGGFSIRGEVVREGDTFEYEPTNERHPILHMPKLGNENRIMAVYALAMSRTLPPIPSVMTIDEIMDVKRRSPGASKPDSPWNDPKIGFIAMALKTPKRRLGRSMPLNVSQYTYASRMDEAFEEQGLPSRVVPLQDSETGARTVVVDGEAATAREFPEMHHEQPVITINTTPSKDDPFAELPVVIADKARKFEGYLKESDAVAILDSRWKRRESEALKQQIAIVSASALNHLKDLYDRRRITLAEKAEQQN